MRTYMNKLVAVGVAGALLVSAASPSLALPLAPNGAAVKESAPDSSTTEVRWRRGWGWGIGLGAFGLGLAAASAYPYGGYYGPRYGYYAYDPYYYGGQRCWRRWGRVYCNY